MKINFIKEYFIPILKTWNEAKKKEGFIPTIDLLIEELEERKDENF